MKLCSNCCYAVLAYTFTNSWIVWEKVWIPTSCTPAFRSLVLLLLFMLLKLMHFFSLEQNNRHSMEWCEALHDFTAETKDDLSFRKGDYIQILERVDSEWYRGRLNDKEGIFPAVFVQICSGTVLYYMTTHYSLGSDVHNWFLGEPNSSIALKTICRYSL